MYATLLHLTTASQHSNTALRKTKNSEFSFLLLYNIKVDDTKQKVLSKCDFFRQFWGDLDQIISRTDKTNRSSKSTTKE
jgi:hypothetical protein